MKRWSFGEIERRWLHDTAPVAMSARAVEAAFDRVDDVLGTAWIEEKIGIVRGPAAVLPVIVMGLRLHALQSVIGDWASLLERVKAKEPGATAELTAIYLARLADPSATIILEPQVGSRWADLLITSGGTDVYVEVAEPNLSLEQREAERVLASLSTHLSQVPLGLAVEVFLRRVPSTGEIRLIEQAVLAVTALVPGERVEIPSSDLGFVSSSDRPGVAEFRSYPDETDSPRLSVISVERVKGGSRRHLAVRLAFADDRADEFLRHEAKQLPKEGVGLLMLHMGATAGGFRTWGPLLRRRLHPGQHTRVSGVVLFSSGIVATPAGENWQPEVRFLENRHAKRRLPTEL